jgi:tetratricopeptide (TPR) repeat protein
MRGMRNRGEVPRGEPVSVPAIGEVEHADWPTLKEMAVDLGLNPKGRSAVVRMRVLDYVRRRTEPEPWRPTTVHQAALLTRLGFPEPAVRMWESTVRLDAPGPWIGLGRAHLLEGELAEAAKAFDRAAAMGDAAAHLARAEALAAEGNFEGAVRACDAYLAARPGDLRGVALKASFVARGGWAEEAANLLRVSFEEHPQVRELWRGLGDLLLRAGKYEVAAEAFGEVVRANPSDAGSRTNRGVALLLAGQTKEAIASFREALEIEPALPESLNDLGVAYLTAGQVKSAITNLERAAKHLEIPTVVTNLAKAYEAGQLPDRAEEAYGRVHTLRPKRTRTASTKPKPRKKPSRRKTSARRTKRPAGATARKAPRRRAKPTSLDRGEAPAPAPTETSPESREAS